MWAKVESDWHGKEGFPNAVSLAMMLYKVTPPQPRNADVPVGDGYDIDLLKPPFNLRPAPLEIVKEDTPE